MHLVEQISVVLDGPLVQDVVLLLPQQEQQTEIQSQNSVRSSSSSARRVSSSVFMVAFRGAVGGAWGYFPAIAQAGAIAMIA